MTESIAFTELDEKTILRTDNLQKYERRARYLDFDAIEAKVQLSLDISECKEDADIIYLSAATDFEARQSTNIVISGTCSFGGNFDKLRFIDSLSQAESGKFQSERVRVLNFRASSLESKSLWLAPLRGSEFFVGYGSDESPNISLAAPLTVLESIAEALRRNSSAQLSIEIATDAYCVTSYGDDVDCVVSPECPVTLIGFKVTEQYNREAEEI